jgi:hypothetical protein
VKRLSRRGFVLLGGAAGAGGVAAATAWRLDRAAAPSAAPAATTTTTTTAPGRRPSGPAAALPPGWTRWSDPASWSRGVPGPGQTATVTRTILLDVDARVAGVTIMPGGRLVFDPRASRRLESSGNVIVRGRLELRPASAAVSHLLVFTGVRERGFAGGGMDVLARDVGLWVMGAGRLALAGAARRAWTRAAGSVAAGATRLTLREDPTGWRPGDELVITPTLAPDNEASSTAYDTATVRAVGGRTVTLDRPLRFAHPAVDVGADAGTGRTQTAEVLNLTRNVRVEGTPRHRAHIFIRSSRPQSLAGVAIRHMGPRKPAEGYTGLVLGRYGLHFHMSGDGSRGSLVDGVVIRDTGSHAFVPHLSNGITFRDCISHNTFEDAYWWDGAPDTRTPGSPSHDILYERCVASMVQNDPAFRGYTLTGVVLGRGDGNVARGCVAVGVQGTVSAAGFSWPEGSEGVWRFEDCVAHNNGNHGIFTWQNTARLHVITRFTGYHNGGAGISHGAYNNRYTYRDSSLYGNRSGAVLLHADSWGGAQSPLQFVNLACDAAGQSDYLVMAPRHNGDVESPPPRFVGCSFAGAGKAAFGWLYHGEDGPSSDEVVDILDCRFAGNEFSLGAHIGADSRIRVRDRTHGSIILRRADGPGTLVPRWNARVEQNPGFRG